MNTLRQLLCIALFLSSSAWAQTEFPRQPIKMVVGFAAGGISDVLARAIAAKMSQNLGQQVIVENRAGAGTTIAADVVARAAPDGYTVFFQDITSHAINASLYDKLSYDSVRDFSMIGMIASTPLMLVVHPSSNARSVKELVALLKSQPGKHSYGSSGNGTILHLAGEMLKSAGALDVQHIPYKGSSPATQAILSNEVSFVFSTMPPAVANARAGKLRALAVTTPKRVPAAPDVPTMMEAGMDGFEVVLYSGIMGPKGMDPAIVRRLNAEFARAVNSDEIRKVFENLGADPLLTTPQAMAELVSKEIQKLGPQVRASGAKVD